MRVLPPLLVLTDRTLCAPRPLVDVVRAAVDGGARAVILREKDLPREERAALADELRPILHDAGGLLIVASDPAIESDGVHLAAADPFPDPRPAIVGRSCHDVAEVKSAEAEGCDYVTLSPMYSSPSKPDYGPPLLHEAAALICIGASRPVYLLGGITPDNASVSWLVHAAGVACMGEIMRAADVARATRSLLDALRPSHRAEIVAERHEHLTTIEEAR